MLEIAFASGKERPGRRV